MLLASTAASVRVFTSRDARLSTCTCRYHSLKKNKMTPFALNRAPQGRAFQGGFHVETDSILNAVCGIVRMEFTSRDARLSTCAQAIFSGRQALINTFSQMQVVRVVAHLHRDHPLPTCI